MGRDTTGNADKGIAGHEHYALTDEFRDDIEDEFGPHNMEACGRTDGKNVRKGLKYCHPDKPFQSFYFLSCNVQFSCTPCLSRLSSYLSSRSSASSAAAAASITPLTKVSKCAPAPGARAQFGQITKKQIISVRRVKGQGWGPFLPPSLPPSSEINILPVSSPLPYSSTRCK